MASTNQFTSFTISQPFLGAPLQFQPALGSKELDELIDRYVTGSASKQNKLSEITIDFYTNATVDLNTGALTRTYNVIPQWSGNAYEQSPTTQSSGSSPVFTTSPGSSANFGDSAYGSFSMTPPTNSRGRVAKKPRKETKKEAEIRLPGFSIMTKDGIDVTSSAGRGTKTKEQREHAHLMRIMKACPDCKRKKIRCDPSHRRSQDMSRTSTSTTKSSSSSASSTHPKPSPPNSVPSLTPQTSYASGSTPSFSPSNAIDDFVLFPEDNWNSDMSLAGLETQDLGQFNFDINDLNQFPQDSSFDFSFDPQLSNFQFDNFGHTPLLADQYGLEQWASSLGSNMPVHTRPHPAGPSRDSGGLDSSFQASWLHDVPAISPANDSLAQGFYPDGSLRQSQLFQNVTTDDSPISSASDWSILEASMNASPASRSSASTPASSSQSQGSSQIRTRKRRAVDEDSPEFALPVSSRQGPGYGIDVDSSDPSDPGSLQMESRRQGVNTLPSNESGAPQMERRSPSLFTLPSNGSEIGVIANFADTCQSTGDALSNMASAPIQATALRSDLRRLQTVLQQVQPGAISGRIERQLQALESRLQIISSQAEQLQSHGPEQDNQQAPELCPDYLRECQTQARRIVRSLCATINSVQAQNTGTSSPTDGPMLTSGRNVHLFASASGSNQPRTPPASLDSGVRMWVESTSQWQLSGSSSSGSSLDNTSSVINESYPTIATTLMDNVGGDAPYSSLSDTASSGFSPGNSSRSLPVNSLPPDRQLPSGTSREQPSSQAPGQDGFASTSLFFNGLDLDIESRRRMIYTQVDSTSDDSIGNVKSKDPPVEASPGAETMVAQYDCFQARLTGNSSGNLHVSELGQTNATTSSSLAQYAGSPQDTRLASQASIDASGWTPRTNVATPPKTQSSAAYNMVLPLLATLFASYVVSSTGVLSSLSPYAQYTIIPFALSYLLPSSTPTSSALKFVSMIITALTAAPLLSNLDYLRQTSSQWIGTDPIVAIVKLTLCAVLTAQLPRYLSQLLEPTNSLAHMGLLVMSFLSQFDGADTCQSNGRSSTYSSLTEESCYSSRRESGSSMSSWLAAMRELSFVVTV